MTTSAAPETRARKPAEKLVIPIAEKLLINVDEFAAVLGIGRKKAWELVYAGKVRTVRIGRLRKITRQDLEAYINGLPEER